MTRRIEFHPLAIEDIEGAVRWYAQQSESAPLALLDDFDAAVDAVSNTPDRWPRFGFGTRRFLLKRFPFAVVYRVRDEVIQVVAVAHVRRRPGFWRTRL